MQRIHCIEVHTSVETISFGRVGCPRKRISLQVEMHQLMQNVVRLIIVHFEPGEDGEHVAGDRWATPMEYGCLRVWIGRQGPEDRTYEHIDRGDDAEARGVSDGTHDEGIHE